MASCVRGMTVSGDFDEVVSPVGPAEVVASAVAPALEGSVAA